MASVTFPVSLGGDGSTVTDDANSTTGLANGGHRTRFVPALAQMVAVADGGVTQATTQVALATTQASNASGSATLASEWASTVNALVAATDYSAKEWAIGTTVPGGSAKTWAQSALNAPGTSATSTSSLAIGIGSKSFTLAQTGKSFVVGQWVSIASSSSPSSQWMLGAITAFTPGTGAMTVEVTSSAGTGTLASWVIAASAPAQSAAPTLNIVTGTSQSALSGNHYVLTNISATTLTLPSTPAAGDVVWVTVGNSLTTNVVARNGSNIQSLAEDLTLNSAYAAIQLRYINSTIGWAFV